MAFGYTTGSEAYSFTTDGYGIFNVRTNFGCVPYIRRGVRHKTVCTRVDQEGQKEEEEKNVPCPARGSNPGSLDLHYDALTTEPCFPVYRSHSRQVADWGQDYNRKKVRLQLSLRISCIHCLFAYPNEHQCGVACYKYTFYVKSMKHDRTTLIGRRRRKERERERERERVVYDFVFVVFFFPSSSTPSSSVLI